MLTGSFQDRSLQSPHQFNCRSRTLLSYAEGRPLEIHNWRAGHSSLPRFISRSLPLCLRRLHNKPTVGCGINGLIPGSFSSVSTTPAYCVAALHFTASLACRAARHPTPRHAAPPVHSSSHVVRRYFLFRRFCWTACRNNYNSTADSSVCVHFI